MIEIFNFDSFEICRLNVCYNLWMIFYILKLFCLVGIEGEMDVGG